jgi:hypothetical protein
MTLVERPWSNPVRVTLQDGLTRAFSSVNDALDFLEHEWPTRHGHHYERALSLCRSAQHRLASAEVARDAFIGACIAASMPVNLVADYRAMSGSKRSSAAKFDG